MSVKKNSIPFRIGIIMTIAVILLSATCYLLYRNLSLIVSSIRIEDNPEMRLLSIRDISMDLEKAGNSVRIYTVTRNPSDIRPYYNVISKIDEKVDRLRSECLSDTVLLQQTDTISKLIEENILIWNELLILYNNDQVINYLQQLSDQITLETDEKNQNAGILKRVFGRKPVNLIDEAVVKTDLDSMVRQDQATKDELVTRESRLAINSSEIKEKFYDLIAKMESEIYGLINGKAITADHIASKSYRLLIMLSISGGLLTVLILFIIIRYTRNAYSYQIALEKSRNEAEILARTKELFMANMSHEIRTPVTAISGFTDQLLREPADEKIVRSLRIIKSSSDHLIKIIDDILDFSKLQNNKIELEKVHFSIKELLDEVYSLFIQKAQQNNVSLRYSIDPATPEVLLGDPYRLKQILINLVSNSVKFTNNGIVSFDVSNIAKEWGAIDLIIEVRDTGIGIDESKIESIFDDFTQAEMSTTRKYGGTGLGLSIVKKLVELHHGTIDLKSKKNNGTLIYCRLPYMTGDENKIRKDPGQTIISIPAEISGINMLVVDDEEYNRLLFRKILERWNVRYNEAVNGMEALELLKDQKFDVLFLDLRMPGIDGLNTARFIRQEMKIGESEMQIVAISAAPVNEEWDKYRKAGINAFLPKPFSEEMLLMTILSVLHNHEQLPADIKKQTDPDQNYTPDGINLDNLYHISGGDDQFVKQMLQSFVSSTEKGISDVTKAAGSGEPESVANIAHKLLSPCRHIGAMRLFNLLSRIETEARKGDLSELPESYFHDLRREFNIVADVLNEHLLKIK
jgi:signal transduction histidine kinase/CheY-like chemotaxis protein/HPt (histidine-containing phosphotransfer) domain-containing protein